MSASPPLWAAASPPAAAISGGSQNALRSSKVSEGIGITTFFAPKLSDIAVFGVMALVLLLRPSGLFGEAGLME